MTFVLSWYFINCCTPFEWF